MGTLANEITAEFAQLYDEFRADVQDAGQTMTFYDDDGATLGQMDSGWLLMEVGQPGFRVLEMRVTDRSDIEFADAVFFGAGGFKYEREGHPVPPIKNPREWVWTVKPVGIDE